MDVQVLYQFPITAPKRELPRAWLFREGSDGILVVAYVSNKVQLSPFSCSLSFLLLDLKSKTILKEVAASYSFTDIEALHLAYDPATMTWVIADLEFQDATGSYHIVARILHDESGQPVLTDPIFDEPARDMAPIGPILALHASNNSCMLMYRKSDIDCSSTPEICLERIDIATQQAEQSIEGCAESALLCQHGSTSLLLTLIPRIGEVAPKVDDVFVGSTRNWGFSVTGYGNSFDTLNWNRVLEIHLAAGNSLVLHGDTDFEWLGINATAIAGPLLPLNGQQTWVIGITMMDIFDLKGHGHTSEEASMIPGKVDTLVCIDKHGKLVQTCTDSIGLRVHLCQATSMVVGVDLVEGHWRLWNWAPLDEAPLQRLVWLDQRVVRAHVVTEPRQQERGGNHFWLIEESSEWVRIFKLDVFTLAEVIPGVMLAGVHLLLPQNGSGSLDWHTSIEVLFYQDTLLLLAVDEHNRLSLYQLR